jgi:hypothetical protein
MAKEIGQKTKSSDFHKLQDAYKNGRFGDLTKNDLSNNPENLVEFIVTNPEINKAYPKLPEETDKDWNKRKVGVFRDSYQPYDLLIPDQKSAAMFLMQSISSGTGQLYDEKGNTTRKLKNALYQSGTGKPGTAFGDWTDGNFLSNMQSEMAAGRVTVLHVASGSNAGRFKVQWNHENTSYYTFIEPVAGMTDAYADMAKVNQVASSKVPGASTEIEDGYGKKMVIKNIPVTEGRSSKIIPTVFWMEGGIPRSAPLEVLESELNNAVFESRGMQNDAIGNLYRTFWPRGAKRPGTVKEE